MTRTYTDKHGENFKQISALITENDYNKLTEISKEKKLPVSTLVKIAVSTLLNKGKNNEQQINKLA